MNWLVVVAIAAALGASACTAGQVGSPGQATQPYTRTYSERSQYQQEPQQAGPFDDASDQQQRNSDQKKQQKQSDQLQSDKEQQQYDKQRQSGNAQPPSP